MAPNQAEHIKNVAKITLHCKNKYFNHMHPLAPVYSPHLLTYITIFCCFFVRSGASFPVAVAMRT